MNESFDDSAAAVGLSELEATVRFPEPSSAAERSDLIDRAYEEYCERLDAGDAVEPDEFCARFPAFETSLRRLLQAHNNLENDPELLRELSVRWPEPGETFLGYRLLSELGRGAFARVFLAQELAVGGRLVAAKLSLHDDREADTLGRLHHPNVVPIFSTQHDAGTGFSIVCMPFLGGTTMCHVIDQARAHKARRDRASILLDAARDGRWPGENAPAPNTALSRGSYVDGVLHVMERLADALHYMHSQGIVHRDLKPSNVLVCPNGVPVLLDFNLALDREVTDYRLGGTLPYMPPEQLRAIEQRRGYRPGCADARTDLYGLGVILYELLAGAHPFGPVPSKLSTLAARDWLLERQTRGPRPIQELNPDIDARLADFTRRCLAAKPQDRPATAEEMLTALRQFQSPRVRARRWARANWKSLTAASVLALLPAGAAGHYLATLPPAAVRNAQTGDEYARAGRWPEALKAYSSSLDADDNQPAVHFSRGRAFMQLGGWQKAVDDFVKSDPDRQDPKAAACMAYCYAAAGEHRMAIDCGQRAAAQGLQTAAVFSNQAYSFQRWEKYEEAIAAADEALVLQSALPEARFVRGSARLQLAEDAAGHARLDKTDPHRAKLALDDFEVAILGGFNSKETYHRAALAAASAISGENRPADDLLAEKIREYVRLAIENGLPREEACNEPRIAKWAPEVTATTTAITGKARSNAAVEGLIDPLADESH
jgi:serine/threonine protein kinase